jgi:MoaA/NifB/PqqE/SkfB family radical SAM enzyme
MCLNRAFKGFKMKDMSIETYMKAIDQALPELDTVFLWGVGEPLLNPNFMKMVGIAKGVGAKVNFSTNGMLLDKKAAEQIVALGVDGVIFSVDGARPGTFEKIRIGAKFEKVMENIRGLIRVKNESGASLPKISLTCTLQKDNLYEVPELVELAHRLGVGSIWFQNLVSWDKSTRDISLLSMNREEIKKVFEKAKETANQTGVKIRLPELSVRGKSVCRFPWFGPPNISWDGTVSLCPWIAYPVDMYYVLKKGSVAQEKTFFNPLIMGDINETTLKEIWNSAKYRKIRESFGRGKQPYPCDVCLHQYQVIC